MANTSNAFQKGIKYFDPSYYIHYHQENIGLADGRGKVPDIITIFKQTHQKASQEAINSYKELLKPNISSNSYELLNEVFNDKDILTELDEEVRTQLQNKIADNHRLQNLMKIEREIFNPKNGFIQSFQNSGQQISSFNTLLEKLADAARLLKTKEGADLAGAILTAQSTSNRGQTVKTMGLKLQEAMNYFIQANNGKTFSQQAAIKAANTINNLASAMITKETKGGSSYSSSSINKLISRIFDTGFAESIAAMSANLARTNIDQALISLTGENPYNLYKYTPGEKWKKYNNVPTEGKADSKQENVNISFSYSKGEKTGDIQLTIGLSNKFYRTQHFPGLDKKAKLTISGGSGGLTIGDAISQLFNIDYDKYLSYNIIAHRSERKKEAQALQNLFMKRFLTNFLATRGGSEDFAQYIIANGEVVSILELILYAEKNFVGFSESTMQGKNQPVAISLPDVAEIEQYTKAHLYNAALRTHEVNNKISKAAIKTYVHVDKILQLRNKKS